jgi:hypothetical protein
MRKYANERLKVNDLRSATRPIRRLMSTRRLDESNMPRLTKQLRIVSNKGTANLQVDLSLLARLGRDNADLRRNVVDLALQIQEIRMRS